MFFWCLCPPRYLALYAYKPQKTDELELRKGEMYRVTEKCQDGWFKGTSLRTAASGVFPGNYVTPVSRSVRCSRSRGGHSQSSWLCNQRLPILPSHKGSGSSLNTVAAIYSTGFFHANCVSREIKPADQAEYEGRELKLWHLLRRVIVGALFVPLGTKTCLKRKKRTFWMCKICECTFSLCDNDTFRYLSAFPPFFCWDFSFYIQPLKGPKLSGHTRSTFWEVAANGEGRGKYCE